MVLVHGIPGSSRSWDSVLPRLADRYDVFVPDLIGFGASPRRGDLLANAQAEALLASMRARGVGSAMFVGHDFGGPVALSLFRLEPAMVEGLVLIAGNVFPDTPIPFPLNTVKLPVLGGLAARLLFSGPALTQLVRRSGGLERGEPSSVRRIFTASLRRLGELYQDHPHALADLVVPGTVVWGTDDPFFPTDQAERTAALLADGELVMIEGGGHMLPETHPDVIADVIGSLSRRVIARSGGRPV